MAMSRSRGVRAIALLGATAVAAIPASARADFFGIDLGPLTTLVAQSSAQLVQLAQSLKTARETYDETRKYVGMAEDAVNTFEDFRAFGQSALQQPERLFTDAFPELGYFQSELKSPERWGRGTGELQSLLRLCLAGGGACTEFRAAVRAEQVRLAISQTFGTAPVGADEVEVLDTEGARAIANSTAQMASAAVTQEQAKALMQRCLRGSGQSVVADCQAAAYAAEALQAQQLGALNEQMALANRLKALELVEQSAERKRELRQSEERRRTVEAGARHMAPLKVEVKTDGLDFFGGQ